jgi:hypothetical protein
MIPEDALPADGGRTPPPERDPIRRADAGAPRRRERERGRKKRGGLGAFLIAGALPAAAVAWILLLPQADRDALFAKIPAGWGGRATHAGIAFGVLIVLARVALPAFHGAAGALRGTAARLAARRGFLRVLLFPYEALVALLRAIVRVLYAVDVALILAAILVVLLLVVRIMKPEFLPGVLPMLGR